MTGLTCEIMQYEKYAPHFNANEIFKIINEHKSAIKEYCYIRHDKDINVDAHWHIYLQFFSVQHYDYISKWFGVAEQFVQKLEHSYFESVLYATHYIAKEKYQYPVSEVFASFNYGVLIDKEKKVNIEIDFTKHNLLFYKELFKYNARKLKELDILWNNYLTIKASSCASRNMRVIYIFGDSGIGKTTLAKMLSFEEYGIEETFISSSSNDLLYGYEGQKCIILDDFREDALSYVDLLKLLDNNTITSVKSRYKNKEMALCECIYITSCISLKCLYENELEDRKQLYRRIGEIFVLAESSKDIILFPYFYDSIKNNYVPNTYYIITNNIKDFINSNKCVCRPLKGEELQLSGFGDSDVSIKGVKGW